MKTRKAALLLAIGSLVLGPVAALLLSGVLDAVGLHLPGGERRVLLPMLLIVGLGQGLAFSIFWRLREPRWWLGLWSRVTIVTGTMTIVCVSLLGLMVASLLGGR